MSLSAKWLPLFVCAALVTGFAGQSSPVNRPWPPDVQKVAADSPPLSAAAALHTFYMPPGYRLDLVAAEPLVQEPVALDWDLQGRLWVVEMPGFMADITGSNEHAPIGRVVVLEDTDRDGRMDKRTVFADGLVLARSVKVLQFGVLVAEPPNLWLMRDTNGDLRADTKAIVSNRFGRRDGDPQNQGNGFVWGLDNRLHTAGDTDLEFRLEGGRIEPVRTLARGEWGVTEDDAGRIYRNTNESALHVDLVPTPYYARHPSLVRTRGSYDRLADDDAQLNTVWPVRPNPGTNRAYQTGIDRPDGTLARFTSACAPVFYRGDRLPADIYGNVFVAEPAANLVSRIVVEDADGGVRARKAYPRGEFLASTDERFRPVFFANAPDGTLYIADLYRGIIEHRISITTYLRDQILARRLDRPTGLGRIYRVMHETTVRDLDPVPTAPDQLVGMLTHANAWRRETAQRLIVEGRQLAAVPALEKLMAAADWRARLRALWTLDGLDALEPAAAITALSDASPHVRVAAVRIAERWLARGNAAVAAGVEALQGDPDIAVRRQLAASLGALPAGRREPAIASLLARHGDDPVTMDAAISSSAGAEANVLQRVARAGESTPPRAAAIAMLAATIVRGADEGAVQTLLAAASDPGRARWIRSATLHGVEIALLNAAMPGARRAAVPTPVVPDLPCATCPGGRAGPGGAYAFQRPGDPTIVNPASRRGPSLRLKRVPSAFTTLAASADEFAARATAVLARVSWPGKPGEVAVAPLTAAETRRFNHGREIYRNICQGCHQPDGRGRDKLAPPLVGAPFTLTTPEIPARILLNGKEGPIGLMPPIGSALNDDQIAAVLTYIRREWGNGGSVVDGALVNRTRAATAARTRPWTDAELNAIVVK